MTRDEKKNRTRESERRMLQCAKRDTNSRKQWQPSYQRKTSRNEVKNSEEGKKTSSAPVNHESKRIFICSFGLFSSLSRFLATTLRLFPTSIITNLIIIIISVLSHAKVRTFFLSVRALFLSCFFF